MSGIAILETINIYQIAWWQFFLGMLPTFIGGGICFLSVYIASRKSSPEVRAQGGVEWHPKHILWMILGALISLILLSILNTSCPADYVETRYEIKIEDSVSFNEVYDNFIILEEKENTFIVKERLSNE